MKVKLINVADYEIKEGKNTNIPMESFLNLCGGFMEDTPSDNRPVVRLFKTINEFMRLSMEEREQIDESEDVRLLSNGQFLVFLKNDLNLQDAAANTKKD